MRTASVLWIGVLLIACAREHEDKPPPNVGPPTLPEQPVRDVAGDRDMRVMLAELASAKACTMMKGQYRNLRAPDRRDVATGVLWIRDCEITNDGTKVTFRLKGNGWQWVDQTKKQVGGTFKIQQYVKFNVEVTIPGAIDMAYDPPHHVVSLWFTPTAKPEAQFQPIGDFDVDRDGAWSSVVGAIGSVFAHSPEKLAKKEAKSQGKEFVEHDMAGGMTFTLDLCSGLARFNLGRPPKGQMAPADVGETKLVPVELHPNGIAFAGPQLAPDGLTMHAEVAPGGGAVRVHLACQKDADAIAQGWLDGKIPAVRLLAHQDVRAGQKAALKIKPVKCPVIAIATPLDNTPSQLGLLRLPSEIAESTGGPLVHCGK
jgi:hypothetical protein